jgi:hypothetical protein
MEMRIFPAVIKELEKEPHDLKESIYGVFERLKRGENIPMPLCAASFLNCKGSLRNAFFMSGRGVQGFLLHEDRRSNLRHSCNEEENSEAGDESY